SAPLASAATIELVARRTSKTTTARSFRCSGIRTRGSGTTSTRMLACYCCPAPHSAASDRPDRTEVNHATRVCDRHARTERGAARRDPGKFEPRQMAGEPAGRAADAELAGGDVFGAGDADDGRAAVATRDCV